MFFDEEDEFEEDGNRLVKSTKGEYDVEENVLRPKTLEAYVGQGKVKENLKVYMNAAKQRGEVLEHVLLYGAPGLGKTTLAHIIANEMGGQLKMTSAPAIERSGDLAAILTNLNDGDVHRRNTPFKPLRRRNFIFRNGGLRPRYNCWQGSQRKEYPLFFKKVYAYRRNYACWNDCKPLARQVRHYLPS